MHCMAQLEFGSSHDLRSLQLTMELRNMVAGHVQGLHPGWQIAAKTGQLVAIDLQHQQKCQFSH